MLVVGVDPGFVTTGFAAVSRTSGRPTVHEWGAIKTPAQATHAARLAHLYDAIAHLLATHRPDAIAIERVFFNANVRTAMAVGQASGAALAAVAHAGIDVVEYTPNEVKQAVAGVGNAPKKQVQAMVGQILGLPEPPEPADAADACALAICHLSRARLVDAVARSGGAA